MNLYDKLDNQIMKGVNAGVRAWNWTTGRTKGDLANGMLSSASIFESVGWINRGNYLFVPLAVLVSHMLQNNNLKLVNAEERAARDGLKDSKAEDYKRLNKILAFLALPNCPYFASRHSNDGIILSDTTTTDYSISLGFGMRTISHYVICADYLPPRKNVLSRATDKIKEWAKELSEKPLGVPAPAFAFERYYNLEERLA